MPIADETIVERLFHEALEIRRAIYGDTLPMATHVLNQLARALQAQGKPAEARELFREMLRRYEKVYTGDHPYLAVTMNNLSATFYEESALDSAEHYHRQALEMRIRLYGRLDTNVAPITTTSAASCASAATSPRPSRFSPSAASLRRPSASCARSSSISRAPRMPSRPTPPGPWATSPPSSSAAARTKRPKLSTSRPSRWPASAWRPPTLAAANSPKDSPNSTRPGTAPRRPNASVERTLPNRDRIRSALPYGEDGSPEAVRPRAIG